MTYPSPVQKMYAAEEVRFIPYGPEISIAAVYDGVEVEYAAIRKGAGVMDGAERSLIEVKGKDAVSFLHNMLTADVKGITAGRAGRSFMVNQKGRLIADLIVVRGVDAVYMDVDQPVAGRVVEELKQHLFMEDVEIEDRTEVMHRLSLHGPGGWEVMKGCGLGSGTERGLREASVAEGGESGRVVMYRQDMTGSVGHHLWIESERVAGVYERMLQGSGGKGCVRAAGWLAFNMARIEAGEALFMVDYGTDSLPHETGQVREAVSFSKGCYRGQEVVARMENLGHAKQVVCGFRAEGEALPVAGAAVYGGRDAEAEVVGSVTSSSPSPMLSNASIGLAMMKWGHHETGTELCAPADGGMTALRIVELPFWSRAAGG